MSLTPYKPLEVFVYFQVVILLFSPKNCTAFLVLNIKPNHFLLGIQACSLTLIPPEKKATANSMLLIFIDFGLAVGSVGLGFLAKNVGYGMTFTFSAAFMIVILLLYLIGSKKTVALEANKEKTS